MNPFYSSALTGLGAPEASGTARPKRILIVEDEAVIALAEAEALRERGYQVDIALDERDALEKACDRSAPVDLVLMDIELGDIGNGAQVARSIGARCPVPVVFLTSHTDNSVLELTEGTRSYGYVVKDSGPDILAASVRMAFRLHEAYTELGLSESRLKLQLWRLELLDQVNKLLEDPGKSVEDCLRRIAQGILEKWRHPEAVCVRISAGTADVRCPGYVHSPWRLSSPVSVAGRQAGMVEVSFRKAVPPVDGETFLPEERLVVDLIARRLGWYLEKRAYEDRLQENSERFRRITEAMTDYIFSVRFAPGRDSVQHGPGCVTVTGYTENELERKPELLSRMILEEDRKAAATRTALLRTGMGQDPIEYRILRKDGETRWVRETDVLVTDGAGRVLGYDGIILDITERRTAEEGLSRALEDQNRLKREFRHYLNNSLAIVVSLINLEMGRVSGEAYREFARKTEMRVCALSSAFEFASREEDGERVRLDDYIRSIASSIIGIRALTSRETALSVDAVPVRIEPGRAIPLGLAAAELVDNALRHACPREGGGAVHVGLTVADGEARLVVSDGGPGLPGEVDPTTCPTIGLTLVRLLAQQLSGRVLCDCAGGGTRIGVAFPVGEDTPPAPALPPLTQARSPL